MIQRLLTATALAAAFAAAAVMTDGAAALLAQAPPAAQAPAAAPAQKPPKPPKDWPPDAAALEKRRREAESLPLFASLDPIEITIGADFKTVQRDRDVKSKKLYPGTLSITKDGVAGKPFPIQLRTRGNVRRNPRLCEFAPLRLEFTKDTVKGTVFEDQNAIKLGTHCGGDGIYQQYTLKEYLANRLHITLTPRALRSRLARVTYADTDPGKKPYTKLGILFEDADDLAKRVDARELPVPRQMFQYLDQPQLLFMSFFNYMIGNTDVSIMVLHNVIMLDDVKKIRYPVPYDFDYSGLVNAHYAAPAKALPITSVQDRLYRGPCKPEAEMEAAIKMFREKQAEVMALPASLVPLGLEEGHRKSAEKYLNEFFELISRPDRFKRTFVSDCKPVAGM